MLLPVARFGKSGCGSEAPKSQKAQSGGVRWPLRSLWRFAQMAAWGFCWPFQKELLPFSTADVGRTLFYTIVWSWWVQETGEPPLQQLTLDMACDGRPRSGCWWHPCSDLAVGEHSPHQGRLRSHSTGWSPKATAPVLLSMGFALFQHFQGPCTCWTCILSVLLPHFALSALFSVPHCSHPCLAHGSLHCPAKRSRVGCFHLPDYASFSPRLSVSQAPVLCPETSGVVSGSASPQQPIPTVSGSLPPLCMPSPWQEMNHPPTAPTSPVLQQQLLGCFLPVSLAGSTTARAAAFWRVKQYTKSREALCNKDCGTGKESSIRLYFGALQLCIPTGPFSSLKPFPHPLCSLFMFTCYPINSPFSCAPAVALSSDHCTGAINPLDCIQLWNIPIWTAGAFICE